MKNLVFVNTQNELYKLATKKKYIILLALGVLICIGRVAGNALIAKLADTDIKLAGITMEMFPFFAEVLVPLVVFMAVTDLFSTEMVDSTIKAVLMRPVSRLKIMTSKILACFIVGVVYYLVIFFACTVLEVVFGHVSVFYMIKSLSAYAIDLIPLLVLILMGVVINMLSKTPTLAMFLCILIYAVMKYCNYFMPVLNTMLFTSYNQWHKLWIGETLPFTALISKIGVILGSGIIFYTAGYLLFDRKEY